MAPGEGHPCPAKSPAWQHASGRPNWMRCPVHPTQLPQKPAAGYVGQAQTPWGAVQPRNRLERPPEMGGLPTAQENPKPHGPRGLEAPGGAVPSQSAGVPVWCVSCSSKLLLLAFEHHSRGLLHIWRQCSPAHHSRACRYAGHLSLG